MPSRLPRSIFDALHQQADVVGDEKIVADRGRRDLRLWDNAERSARCTVAVIR